MGFYPPDGGKTLYDESSPGGRGDFFSELVTDWEGAARLSSASSAGWSVRQVRLIIFSFYLYFPKRDLNGTFYVLFILSRFSSGRASCWDAGEDW